MRYTLSFRVGFEFVEVFASNIRKEVIAYIRGYEIDYADVCITIDYGVEAC
jgi:hypothetical protein